MSEGTPGRGPDADSRTDTGDGQATTDGRPAVPPVRYGPRNGSPSNGANGRGGSNGRPVSAPSSPQQYRAPRTPADPTPTQATTPVPGSNGSEPNGSGSNGSGTNGSGTNGAHAATPSSYTRPRTNGTSTRPEPSEQDRRVADARIAAAARNASAAKVRGGSVLGGNRAPAAAEAKTATPDASAPVDETAVIPAVVADETAVVTPAEATDTDATTTSETPTPGSDKPRGGRFGRLRTRDRRPAAGSAMPVVTPEAGVETPTAESPTAEAPTTTEVKADEPSDATPESAAAATDADTATTERPLTWRDRLGLPPKAKAQPDTAPETDAASTGSSDGAGAGSAVAAGLAGAAAAGGTTQVTPGQDRVSPSPFAPGGSSDTVVIRAIDVAATGAPVPVAGATALPVVAPAPAPAPAPKAKVGAARRTRKARLRLSRVDPWSVMKTALLFSIAAGIILVVATYGVWSVLNASGLFDAVNDMVKSVVSTPGDTTPFRIEDYVNTQKIIGVAALIAVVDVLIFTALATLGSFLYNLAATVLGGLEVTLAED